MSADPLAEEPINADATYEPLLEAERAAAALALEISASSAMATAGSENFFQAHHERGGLR